MNIESIPVADLIEDQANARKHDDKNIGAIAASLKRFGQQKPIVVRGDGVVVAGNGTLQAAKRLGWDKIDVVRTELEGGESTAFAIIDNRTAELAEWDADILKTHFDALPEVEWGDLGWEPDDIALATGVKPEIIEDEVPEPPVDPITKPGDVWKCGEHRVLCGDATKAEDVERLMAGAMAQMVFTDPPYGVGYDGGTTKRDKLAGDSDTNLYGPACDMAASHSDDKAPLYLWHAGVKGIAAAAAAAAAAAGYEIRCELVWNKNHAQFGSLSAQYKQKHEPCYYCFKRGIPPRWHGPTSEVTVWDCDRAAVNEYHPTQKPVALAARAMRNSTLAGEAVLDLFLGSGSTLVACEQLNRKCYGIEIEPKYVDVAVKRWENLTGKKAVLA